MVEIGQLIFSFISNNANLNADIDSRIYPVAAEDAVLFPFLTYTILQQSAQTKDANTYAITLSTYFKSTQYTECATYADLLKTEIEADGTFDWEDSTIGFIEEDQSYVANVNIRITK